MSAVIDLPVVERIEGRRHVVEFVIVEIGVGMGGHVSQSFWLVWCDEQGKPAKWTRLACFRDRCTISRNPQCQR